ncbi:MAG: 30S ribosomal protein S8 [Patescibacteria group bacterium]
MYYDLLTKIKNAEAARKKSLRVPFSKLDQTVGEILVKHSFIKDVKKKLVGKKKFLDIDLATKASDEVLQFKIVSKPSRHLYVKSKELFPVKQGYGVSVISTSQGLMTGGEAKKRRLGGEYLFEVW